MCTPRSDRTYSKLILKSERQRPLTVCGDSEKSRQQFIKVNGESAFAELVLARDRSGSVRQQTNASLIKTVSTLLKCVDVRINKINVICSQLHRPVASCSWKKVKVKVANYQLIHKLLNGQHLYSVLEAPSWYDKSHSPIHAYIHTPRGGCCHAGRCQLHWVELQLSVLLKDTMTGKEGAEFKLPTLQSMDNRSVF